MLPWWRDREGDMVEGALTLPLLTLITLAFCNLALAGYVSILANNAAAYGARVGSVAQRNAGDLAADAAREAVIERYGRYVTAVEVTAGDPGDLVVVRVRWQVPNFFAGALRLLGGPLTGPIAGVAQSAFVKEGW